MALTWRSLRGLIEQQSRAVTEFLASFSSFHIKPNLQTCWVRRDAVTRFKRVVSLLTKSSGHGRVRVVNKAISPSYHNKLLSDNQLLSKMEHSPNPYQQLPRTSVEGKVHFLDSSAKNPFQLSQRSLFDNQLVPQALSSSHYQLLQHLSQNAPGFQLRQQMKLQAGMFRRSDKFESSSHTPSASTTRSLSSLSMDGSVASLDGKPFHLICVPASSDLVNLHLPPKRRCVCRAEDGNGKYATCGRCHCSKRRWGHGCYFLSEMELWF